MRKRGVEDFELAMIDPWASSYTGPDDHPSKRRICRPLTWVRSAPGEHGYARPVENLVATVDLDTMEVVDVADYGVVPLPEAPGNYEEPWIFEDGNVPSFKQYRDDVKPIEITQPEGPSFTVDGHHVNGRSGTCASASRRARASSCTRSATTTAARCGRSSTAPAWRRCTSRTGIRRPRTGSRTCSTRASTASGGWRTR